MTQTLQAVYENGVFRPLFAPVGVPVHAEVTISLKTVPAVGTPRDFVGSMPPEDAEEMQDIVRREFGRVDPAAWK